MAVAGVGRGRQWKDIVQDGNCLRDENAAGLSSTNAGAHAQSKQADEWTGRRN